MVKFANWLKRAKKIKDVVGKGASWLNTNIVKPALPVAKKVLEATGYGTIGNFIEKGSDLVDNVLEKQGYKAKNDIGKYVKFGSEYLYAQRAQDAKHPYDTQKLPSERKKHSRVKTGIPLEFTHNPSTEPFNQAGKFKKLF